MLKDQIVVGRAYINGRARVVREVIEEVDEQRVKFNAFDLASGRLLPSRHRTCPKAEIAAWADREASPRELALIHPFEAAAWVDSPAPRDDHAIQLEAARSVLESATGPHAFPQPK